MAAKIPFGSIEYLHVPITRDDDSVAVDLTAIGAEIAILADSVDPAAAGTVWHAAIVTGDAQEAVARYLLDGTLARGRWAVWVRLSVFPEQPLRRAGLLTVT